MEQELEQPNKLTEEQSSIYADFYTAIVDAAQKNNLNTNETLAYLAALIGNVLGCAYPAGPRSILRAHIARSIDIAAAVADLAATPAEGSA